MSTNTEPSITIEIRDDGTHIVRFRLDPDSPKSILNGPIPLDTDTLGDLVSSGVSLEVACLVTAQAYLLDELTEAVKRAHHDSSESFVATGLLAVIDAVNRQLFRKLDKR